MVRIVQLVRTSDCGSEGRRFESVYAPNFGGLAEWSIAPVLKTGGPKGPIGSNPIASAMKTKITFKGIDDYGRVIRRTIPIEHNFTEQPAEEFMGVLLPPVSVENQVIEYLDTIDKSDIMNKYGFYIILDYYPYIKRNKKKELEEFITYLSAIMPIDRSVIAVISESKDVLFGKGKSNYTKAVELINMQQIAFKAAGGMLEMINKMLNPKYERQCTPKVLKNEINEIDV